MSAGRTNRRTARLLLFSLVGQTAAAVLFFAAGFLLPGALAVVAGLATLVAAARHARPANWTPEDRDHRGR